MSWHTPGKSYLIGPNSPPLWDLTLSQMLEERARADPDRDCVVFPETGNRHTYDQLYRRSKEVAKGLLACGLQHGDHVGIQAGNRAEYCELIFATSHIGVALVILNNAYNVAELRSALKQANCKMHFTAEKIGPVSNAKGLEVIGGALGGPELPDLQQIVVFTPWKQQNQSSSMVTYESMIARGKSISNDDLDKRTAAVDIHDVCNLQFTSGTTGSPKAALLTHYNLVNNGKYIGDRMVLTPNDSICCPPPLFHCFGLVLGLLACMTHGSTIVFPGEAFNPAASLKAVIDEKCTGLHGVPSMFSAQLDLLPDDFKSTMRTGIAAGAPVPKQLMEDLRERMNLKELTITYGMTETSPASFMSYTDDPIEKRLTTVGRIVPHTRAKIINGQGEIVPIGERGELCVAGPQLQKGYYKNPQKTAEAMKKDEDGILWMYTGDEALFDDEGYCRITGRIKDLIIRGGENIAPLQIEERLVQHKSILQASVVGVPDKRYDEVVGAFLQGKSKGQRPDDDTIRNFVGEVLSHQKKPVYIFWLAQDEQFPQTGSGKIKKHVLRDMAVEILKQRKSKL